VKPCRRRSVGADGGRKKGGCLQACAEGLRQAQKKVTWIRYPILLNNPMKKAVENMALSQPLTDFLVKGIAP
jgi:hypothetical protein